MTSTSVNTPVNVDAVFTALEAWINRRPGLDYGALTPYRAELRSIAADKKRALKALDEARGLEPAKPELLADAFTRAFSGRLSWVTTCEYCGLTPSESGYGCDARPQQTKQTPVHSFVGSLDYCTGQYWPTEYRKAAASVLETYIATWRQSVASETNPTFVYQTIEDVKAANRSIGHHYFDRGTMRFFNSKIESGLIGGKYFITSERMELNMPKRYSVRMAAPDGTIDSIGEFQQYDSKEDAREAIRAIMSEVK
jgi:hypothetical protein